MAGADARDAKIGLIDGIAVNGGGLPTELIVESWFVVDRRKRTGL